MKSARVDYDAIADSYDSTPYRTKLVDPELLAFIGQRVSSDELVALDIGCGTGNQLIANCAALISAQLIGVDRSSGMLKQARRKAPNIAWVQADAAAPPFQAESFDFVTCQFAFHHIQDKSENLCDAFRVLKPRGSFIMKNVCPHDCSDWLFYIYFPEALTIDLHDFWSPEEITTEMDKAGFDAVAVDRDHLRVQQDLRAWLKEVRQRRTCSQLLAIPDAAYEAGLRRLTQELADQSSPVIRENHLCLVTIRGEKRRDGRKCCGA